MRGPGEPLKFGDKSGTVSLVISSAETQEEINSGMESLNTMEVTRSPV